MVYTVMASVQLLMIEKQSVIEISESTAVHKDIPKIYWSRLH